MRKNTKKTKFAESNLDAFRIRFMSLYGNILAIDSILADAKKLVDPKIFAGMDRIDKASERIHDLIESHGNVFGCLLKHLRDEITLTERLLLSDEEKKRSKKRKKPSS